MPNKNAAWEVLNGQIIRCNRCPRLISYIQQVAKIKVRRFRNDQYWGKPVPGFGDVDGRVLIVGLAPGAHGANRTGRMFTGDSSGDWLFKALSETGFANQPMSQSRTDGLVLRDVFISASIRCAPPKNRPTAPEIANCSRFLLKEWELLKNIKLVLALGHIAFDVCLRYLYPDFKPKPPFQHGRSYEFNQHPLLVASYHPSRQNTQTGRLDWNAWRTIFTRIRTILKPQISDDNN